MISTKGRYAVRVMIDLAENGKEHAIPLTLPRGRRFPKNIWRSS